MKHRIHLALLATLATMPGWAQQVSFSTTSFAQAWKQDTNGFSTGTYFPLTEYVAVDATGLAGREALSVHVYGWGLRDLGDASSLTGKTNGDLTYAYAQYRFPQANAEIKAGRITVNDGPRNETLDGVWARTDLRYGFTVSAFGGQPVVYKNHSNNPQADNSFQQDIMAGGRLAWRAARLGEIGVSYLQDGSQAAYQYNSGMPVDYTRREVGADIRLMPCSFVDLSGRTVFDVAAHPQPVPGTDPSRIAEHDYKATAKVAENVSVTALFIERKYFAYYAGTSLPSLFNQNEQGMFKASGASVTWGPTGRIQVVGDVRRTDRGAFGTSTRVGADVRYTVTDTHFLAGGGYHRVNAYQVAALDFLTPAYSLSHDELKAWVMATQGAYSASLNALRLFYADSGANPNLNGKATETALMGSLGYQAKPNLKFSGDLTLEDTPLYRRQTAALVRVDYQFSFAGKGGK